MRLTAILATGTLLVSVQSGVAADPPVLPNAKADTLIKSESDRGFRVRLNESGAITARFSVRNAKSGELEVTENVRVKLIRNGRIVAKSRMAEGGTAELKAVTPGAYSLIAITPTSYASVGMEVLPADAKSSPEDVHVFLVPKVDYQAISAFYSGSAEGLVASKSQSAKVTSFVESSLREPKLLLRDGGVASGQVFGLDQTSGLNAPVANARLAVIRDGKVSASTTTDAEGRYTVSGLSAGPYTLATASPEGFSAFGVIASREETAKVSDENGREFVGFGHSNPCCVEHAVICQDAIPFEPLCSEVVTETIISEPIVEEYLPAPLAEAPLAPMAPLGGGGGFGGGFGGGGGGFGGGGLGLALGAGGLAAGLFAIADDDDDDGRISVDQPGDDNGSDFINRLTDDQVNQLLSSLNDDQIEDLLAGLDSSTRARVQRLLDGLGNGGVSPSSSDDEED